MQCTALNCAAILSGSYNSECNELFQGSVERNASSEKAYAFNCEAIRQVLTTANAVNRFKVLTAGAQATAMRKH